jgi:hypothetical protein
MKPAESIWILHKWLNFSGGWIILYNFYTDNNNGKFVDITGYLVIGWLSSHLPTLQIGWLSS